MNILVIIVLAVVLLGGGYWLMSGNSDTGTDTPIDMGGTVTPTPIQPTPTIVTQPTPTTGTSMPTLTPQVKAFTVTGSNFKFSLKEIRVKKGDTVRITFKNSGGNHDWKVDEFNAGTKVLSTGQEETIEFVANKTGTFEYYCSVGSHRSMGMKGNLVVE